MTECLPDVKEFKECEVVFSGLDEKVGEIGELSARYEDHKMQSQTGG